MGEMAPAEVVSRGVDTAPTAWETEVYERAFHLWASTGRNAARVERLLLSWAREITPDGGEVPPVPAARTIQQWVRDDDWERKSLLQLMEDLPRQTLRMREDAGRLAAWAIQELYDIKTGKYDGEPALIAVKSRDAHDTLKMFGLGTFGSNAGGEFLVSVAEVMSALGLGGGEEERLSDTEKSRALRAAIEASKRGKE